MKLKVTEQMLFVGAAAIAGSMATRQLNKRLPKIFTQPVAGAMMVIPALLLYNDNESGRARDLNLILLGLMAGGLGAAFDGKDFSMGGIGGPHSPVQINVR